MRRVLRCAGAVLALISAFSCTREEAEYVDTIRPSVIVDHLDSAAVVGRSGDGMMTALDIIEEMQMLQQQEQERLQSEARIREMRLWMIIFLLLAVLVSLVWYFISRKLLNDKLLQEEKAENERLMSIAEDLKARLGARGRDTELLERLCEQYYIYEGTENLQPKILREVGSVIDDLRAHPDALEDDLNQRYGDIVKRLRAQLPSLKEDDVHLFCYLASGFSSTTISTLMEKDKQYVYNRVYRLKGRLQESAAPDQAEFLSAVGK